MEFPSYNEYLRHQRELYSKKGKNFDEEMKKQREMMHKSMHKHLPEIRSEEDLYFNNMD